MRRLMIERLTLSIIGVGVLFSSSLAEAPKLTRIFPAGGQCGTRVEVTCKGDFTWPLSIWAPGLQVECGETKGQLFVTVPEVANNDRYWIRLYSADGASAKLPFLVGTISEQQEVEPNDRWREAQLIETTPITVNGVLEKSPDVDVFAVQLAAGQGLVVALEANRRLGSPMDAILQIATADGVVLAENHDDAGLDPRLHFVAPQDGSYQIRLFAFPSEPDTRIAFRGGENYVYRLTISREGYVTHTQPIGSFGSRKSVQAAGWDLEGDLTLPIRVDDAVSEVRVFGDVRDIRPVRFLSLLPANRAGCARYALGEDVEPPTSDRVASAVVQSAWHSLSLPAMVTGAIQFAGQQDDYRLQLEQGQSIALTVEAVSLDFPTVPLVHVYDMNDKVVAQFAENAPTGDAVLSFTAAEAGEYRVHVADRYGAASSRHHYLLCVWEPPADVVLTAATEMLTVTKEVPAELEVAIKRYAGADGNVGELTVEAVGLPPGVTCESVVSKPGEPTADKVTLKFVSAGQPYQGPLLLQGRSTAPRELIRPVRSPTQLDACLESLWIRTVGSD
ncbi:MAG: PPC domain-containing protein [Planctomycetales bacterium]|nr:PPC domain-containing protein [Planctomycetales bacterium]